MPTSLPLSTKTTSLNLSFGRARISGLANFAESEQSVDTGTFGRYGWLETVLSSDGPLTVHGGRAHLPALGFVTVGAGLVLTTSRRPVR